MDAIMVRLMEQIDVMKATIDAHVGDPFGHPHEHEPDEPPPPPPPEPEPEPVVEDLPPPEPVEEAPKEDDSPKVDDEKPPERHHPLHGRIGGAR